MKRLVIIAALWAAPLAAHEWYDAICCSGKDCAPIPRAAVSITPEGWLVTLNPGDHPLATQTVQRLFPFGEERRSEDGDFHACIYPKNTLRCFYAPPMGS